MKGLFRPAQAVRLWRTPRQEGKDEAVCQQPAIPNEVVRKGGETRE